MNISRLIYRTPSALWLAAFCICTPSSQAAQETLRPIVEVEEEVYTYESANNGAGPMWCGGSTCLVRIGDKVFASGLETLRSAKPLNNCRWILFQRGKNGWSKRLVDESGKTREPSPLVGFPDGRLFLSANPTLGDQPEPNGGPARPEIIQLRVNQSENNFETIQPEWDGAPRFREHSYRSFAADGENRELILFQNIGYTHAEWTFRDRDNAWSLHGKLHWPWGSEYDTPQPIRVCYPNVALRNRAVYFCGVSDIVEPYLARRKFKKELTGNDWDYDFRRLFFTWTPDIATGRFSDWIEIASRDRTGGWISPGDLWVAPDGDAHIIWTERAIDERLQARFFPTAQQSYSLNYAIVRDGKIRLQRPLLIAEKGGSREIPSMCRFQVTSENRLFVVYYASGTDPKGHPVSENRVMEILDDGKSTEALPIRLNRPFTNFFTATIRAGSPAGSTLEMLGHQAGKPLTISYARIRLW